VSPSLEESGFSPGANLTAEFDLAPDSVTMSLSTAMGDALEGTQEIQSDGRIVTFDPTEDLAFSTAYTLTIEWTPSAPGEPPVVVGFQTSAACAWGHNDPGDLVSDGNAVGDTIANVPLVDQCGEAVSLWDLAGEYHILYQTAAW